jgi:hypothetical protein
LRELFSQDPLVVAQAIQLAADDRPSQKAHLETVDGLPPKKPQPANVVLSLVSVLQKLDRQSALGLMEAVIGCADEMQRQSPQRISSL